jgi:hypothetical protein
LQQKLIGGAIGKPELLIARQVVWQFDSNLRSPTIAPQQLTVPPQRIAGEQSFCFLSSQALLKLISYQQWYYAC